MTTRPARLPRALAASALVLVLPLAACAGAARGWKASRSARFAPAVVAAPGSRCPSTTAACSHSASVGSRFPAHVANASASKKETCVAGLAGSTGQVPCSVCSNQAPSCSDQ